MKLWSRLAEPYICFGTLKITLRHSINTKPVTDSGLRRSRRYIRGDEAASIERNAAQAQKHQHQLYLVNQGSKEMSKEYVLDQLGLHGGVGGGDNSGGRIMGGGQGHGFQKERLEELGIDEWHVLPGNRSLRCTEVSLCVAVQI
nr:protein transport protein SEC23-like [Tanacetum cinerariifolium]